MFHIPRLLENTVYLYTVVESLGLRQVYCTLILSQGDICRWLELMLFFKCRFLYMKSLIDINKNLKIRIRDRNCHSEKIKVTIQPQGARSQHPPIKLSKHFSANNNTHNHSTQRNAKLETSWNIHQYLMICAFLQGSGQKFSSSSFSKLCNLTKTDGCSR